MFTGPDGAPHLPTMIARCSIWPERGRRPLQITSCRNAVEVCALRLSTDVSLARLGGPDLSDTIPSLLQVAFLRLQPRQAASALCGHIQQVVRHWGVEAYCGESCTSRQEAIDDWSRHPSMSLGRTLIRRFATALALRAWLVLNSRH